MNRRLRGSESWLEGGAVRHTPASGQSGQSPGVSRLGGSQGCGGAFGLLCGTLEVDDRKMSPAVQELDLQPQAHARLALHQGHRLGTARGGKRQSTGKELRMRETYDEGLASRTGPSHAPVSARAGARRWSMGTCRPVSGPRNRTQTGGPPRARAATGAAASPASPELEATAFEGLAKKTLACGGGRGLQWSAAGE